jgi:hypothetical protein
LGLKTVANDPFDGVRRAFLDLLWKQIEENANGRYPAVLPVLILTVGLKIGDSTAPHGQQRRKLIEFLETAIRPKLLAGETMLDKRPMDEVLLSTHVEFNRTTGRFEYLSASDREVMELE